MSSAMEDRNRIVYENIRPKDMKSVGNIVAIQKDPVIIATEDAQQKYRIRQSHGEEYNGAWVFLDFSTNDVFTLNNGQSKEEELEFLGLNPRSNLDSNSSSINQEKADKKKLLESPI
jgi:hypothetical protein